MAELLRNGTGMSRSQRLRSSALSTAREYVQDGLLSGRGPVGILAETALAALPSPVRHKKAFLLTAASVVVGGGVVENHRRAVNAWKRWPKTELTAHPYEGEQTNVSGVVVQGFGKVEGKLIAEKVAKAIPEIRWGSFDYNNITGLTVEDLATELTRYKEETNAQYLDAYVPSMGLPTLLLAAKAADIPLRNIFANSSPFGLEDGKANGLGKIVKKTPYHFGVIGKVAGTLVTRRKQHGKMNWKQKQAAWKEAWRERGVSSPMLLGSQVALLENPAFQNPESFKDIINPEFTNVYYFSPDPKKDTVVYVERALPKWVEFFAKLGIRVESVPMPESDHANHGEFVKTGVPIFEKLYKRKKEEVVFPNVV